jgi:hypothetical protein
MGAIGSLFSHIYFFLMCWVCMSSYYVDAYSRIVEKTNLKGSSFSSMLTMNKEDFEDTFKTFSPLHQMDLKAMRGRYQERCRQGVIILHTIQPN